MSAGAALHRRTTPVGELALRPLDPVRDADVVHAWVTHPRSAFWQMLDADLEAVVAAYSVVDRHPHHDAYLGLHDGTPAFLAERYDPRHVELAGRYDARPGDVGMHLLCAPPQRPVHGFTRCVMSTVLSFLFADPAVRRVVVEPDVRNTAVHALNAAAGFEVVGELALPHKTALLSTCTREAYAAAQPALETRSTP